MAYDVPLRGYGPAWTGDAGLAWTRSDTLAVVAIVGLGLLLRAAAAVVIPSPLESDYLGYWTIANNFYAGNGLTGADGLPTAFLSLGYPIMLAGVFLVAGPSIAAVKVANVVLGTASVYLVYLVARRLFASRLAAVFAALAVAVYLELVVYTAYVAKENLMVFLVLAQLAVVTMPRPRMAQAIVFGLVTGALAVAGNAAIAMLPALAWQIYLQRRRIWWAIGYLVVAVVFAALVMAPLSWRNHQVFNTWNINNNAGFNLYVGNNERATPFFESIVDTPIGDRWQEIHERFGERGSDLLLRDLAVKYIGAHPVETVTLSLRKAAAFWLPSLHEGKGPEGTVVRVIRLVSVVEYVAVCLLFLASLLAVRRYAGSLSVLWLMVLGYTAVHMLFYVIYRYRLPIVPVLCLGAGVSLQMLWPWKRAELARSA